MTGFFDRFVPLPDAEHDADDHVEEHEQPLWAGHPRAVLPGRSTTVATLFRTEAAALVLCCVDVYPSGLEFSLRLLTSKADRRSHNGPLDLGNFGRSEPSANSVRLGVEFSDGRCWSSTSTPPNFSTSAEGSDIVLMSQGGGGGGRFWEFRFWLWPLPPDGPLTFHTEWPAKGIPESSTVIDASELQSLARLAITIDLPSA
jgi:hypothetical protein